MGYLSTPSTSALRHLVGYQGLLVTFKKCCRCRDEIGKQRAVEARARRIDLPGGQRHSGMYDAFRENFGVPGVGDRDLMWLSLFLRDLEIDPGISLCDLCLSAPRQLWHMALIPEWGTQFKAKMCSLILKLIFLTHPNWYYLCRQSGSGKKPKCTQSRAKVSSDYIRLSI